jgi:hypothetical protein
VAGEEGQKSKKRGVAAPCCYPFLGSHTKNKNKYIYTKKYILKKNIWKESNKKIGVRKGYWNVHKMARNWLKRFKNTRIKI